MISAERCGRGLDRSPIVQLPSRESTPFPCPFCRSGATLLIGGNRLFLHYICGKCSEVWTVTDAVRPAHGAAHCFEAALTIGETRH